jgi:dihydroorotate dehydrogenase (NAD+) catalytic subunit
VALELSSGKTDVRLERPWLNLPGTLGFSDEARNAIDLGQLGALVTNPVSLAPRRPANPPRSLRYPGGLLLHTGHANPGLRRTIRQHGSRWAGLPVPVLVSVLAQDAGELGRMVADLESIPEASGLVLFLPSMEGSTIARWVEQATSLQRPVVALLPLGGDLEAVLAAAEAGAAAILLGPPRGSLEIDGQSVEGRLYGPGLFPLALQSARELAPLLPIPLIVSGGIATPAQARACLQAGASAVGLDFILWKDPQAFLSDEAWA